MARLFVEHGRLADDLLVLGDEDHRYLTRVLRLGVGDRLVLFDGIGVEADAQIVRIGPRALELKIEGRRLAPAAKRPDVTLIQAIPKGDKLDFVVQKATELGVARILPVTTLRSVPRFGDAEARRTMSRRARWQKIAREAARQSGRPEVPEIEPVTALSTALAAAPKDALKLLLWEGEREHTLRDVIGASGKTSDPIGRIVIGVGPEGGFAPEEAEAARAAGFHTVGLGPRILRTETAALVTLAILGYALGDLG
jgi:16S rRNA (uracil1498-N3)-methyltransferase